MVFTANMPLATQSLNYTQPLVLGNFANYKANMEVNHGGVNDADAGKHKFVQMPAQAADPATAADEVAIYCKDAGGGVYREYLRQANNGTVVQITGVDPLNAGNGYTFLPGGLLMQWGLTTPASATANTAIVYPIAFSAAAHNIQLTFTRAASSPGTTFGLWVVTGSTNTGFTAYNNSGHTYQFYWMAIGSKA